MLKVSTLILQAMESEYPGIAQAVLALERAWLPACRHCESRDTAQVRASSDRYAQQMALATSKIHVMQANVAPGLFYCNDCGRYFD